MLQPQERDFNLIRIEGREASSDLILKEAQTLPIFSSRRMVVLKEADQLPASQANLLIPYLKDPNPTTCFVILARNIDLRRSFFQVLTRTHPVVECKSLSESLIPKWIQNEARGLGYAVTGDAVQYLVDQIGSDLFGLRNELMKATLMAQPSKTITVEHLHHVYRGGGHCTVSDLLSTIGERKAGDAIRNLRELLESGEAPLLILSALLRQFRQFLSIRELLSQGIPDKAIQGRLKLWPAIWSRLLRQAKAFSIPDLYWSFKRMAETDAALKGSGLPPNLIMESLVVDLTMGPRKGLRRFLGSRHQLIYLER